ncbi:hypothetical protein ABTK68_19485, partial [Acinetobacter baumannii]
MTSRRLITSTALATCLAGSLSGALAAEPAPGPTTVRVSLPTAALQVQINQVALERSGPKRA